MRIGSGDVRTHILCAHYDHDPAVSTQVFAPLGDLVHLRAGHAGDGLDDTLRLLARELAAPRLATSVVLDSLVDILLVQLLRVWLAARPRAADPSWLGALRDPLVGAAVAKLHDDPGRDWTTAALAREIAVSRATLSRRFASVLGESPAATSRAGGWTSRPAGCATATSRWTRSGRSASPPSPPGRFSPSVFGALPSFRRRRARALRAVGACAIRACARPQNDHGALIARRAIARVS